MDSRARLSGMHRVGPSADWIFECYHIRGRDTDQDGAIYLFNEEDSYLSEDAWSITRRRDNPDWDAPESETLATFGSLSEALAYLDNMGGDQ